MANYLEIIENDSAAAIIDDPETTDEFFQDVMNKLAEHPEFRGASMVVNDANELIIVTKEEYVFKVDEYGNAKKLGTLEDLETNVPEEIEEDWLRIEAPGRNTWCKNLEVIASSSYEYEEDVRKFYIQYTTNDVSNPDATIIWVQVPQSGKFIIKNKGTYTFRLTNGLKAIDSKYWKSETFSFIDNEAPPMFEVTATEITRTTIKISGTAYDEGVGEEKYLFCKDGGLWVGENGEENAWTTSNEYTFEGLTPETTYKFKMKAIDGLENGPTETEEIEVTTDDREVDQANGNVTTSIQSWDTSTPTPTATVQITANAGYTDWYIQTSTDGNNWLPSQTELSDRNKGSASTTIQSGGDIYVRFINKKGVDSPSGASGYATFTPVYECTVTYNKNTGTGTNMSTSNHKYGQNSNLIINTYTKAGHTFLGWSTSNTATTAMYTDGQQVNNLKATDNTTSLTLYAVWKEVDTANGHVSSSVQSWNTSTTPPTATVKFTANSGYTDWYMQTSTNGSTWLPSKASFSNSNKGQVTGTITSGSDIYARFVDAKEITSTSGASGYATASPVYKCTITYDKNADDATGTMGTTDVIYNGGAVNLRANAFTRTNYTLIGWSRTSGDNNTIEFEPGAQVSNITGINSTSLTLYAVWDYDYVNASDVNFEPADNSWNVNNVQDALDSLYEM